MSRDIPIIFSTPMIRALLNGHKNQTRRLASSPFAKVQRGDRLWVRESAAVRYQGFHHKDGDTHQVSYRADEDGYGRWLGLPTCGNGIRKGKAPSVFPSTSHKIDGSLRWHPSIHMPRWASRMTLVVDEVRFMPLQAISEEDAKAEGTREPSLRDLGGNLAQAAWSERQVFSRLWERLNGSDSWNENPDVVAVTFSLIRANIDAMPYIMAA